MKYPEIDKTKLPIVKKVINKINYFVVNENCDEESLELIGLEDEASDEEIMKKIIADKKY